MGVYDLRMPGEAVWDLTMRQFVLLTDRWKDEQRRKDRRSGEVVAMLYNVNRDSKKDPDGKSWMDIYPEHAAAAKREQTEDEMLDAMMMWAKRRAN